jgi:hypothetical protein
VGEGPCDGEVAAKSQRAQNPGIHSLLIEKATHTVSVHCMFNEFFVQTFILFILKTEY